MQLRPNAPAMRFKGCKRSYSELGERVARLAGALRAMGMAPGDRVGLLAANSDRTLEFYLAVWWAGGSINPVNTRWSVPEMAYSLNDCDTRILFIDDPFLALVDALRRQAPAVRTWAYIGRHEAPAGMADYEALIAGSAPVEDALRCGKDLAGVFYTGGTTGKPKGVMLSHESMVLNGQMLLLSSYLDDTARLLHVAPLFHLAGLTSLLRGILVGCEQIILPGFTIDGVLHAIEHEGATHLMVMPTMLQMLVDDPRSAQADLSGMCHVGYGASPITEALLERAFALFPHAQFVQGYGMTELCAAVTCLAPRYHTLEGRRLGRLTSAGQAITGIDIRICDAKGRELPLGEVGEIQVRSPCVMLGYWNLPEQTTQAMCDGWFRTGDAGRMSDEGFVYIVDRFKDMIVSGGENVYCAEVEGALAQHPAVAAAAVIGVPSQSWGEAVHAVVVRRPDTQVDPRELIDHCHRLIAGYKCPRSVEFVDALPLSSAGKVLKFMLREVHWSGQTRGVS